MIASWRDEANGGWGRVLYFIRAFYQSRTGSGVIRLLVRFLPTRLLILLFLACIPYLMSEYRNWGINEIAGMIDDRKARRTAYLFRFINKAFRQNTLYEIEIALLIASQEFDEAISRIQSCNINIRETPIFLHYLLRAYSEIGYFRKCIDVFDTYRLEYSALHRRNLNYMVAAYAAGMSGDAERVERYFSLQYDIPSYSKLKKTDDKYGEFWPELLRRSLSCAHTDFVTAKFALNEAQFGIFFVNSPLALGHALLDAFRFLDLYRNEYDRIVYIGPPTDSYAPGPRVCIQILEQYGRYVVTKDESLMNAAGINLGHKHLRERGVGINCENYWGLMRNVYLRSIDPDDAYSANTWFLDIPESFREICDLFCERHGINLSCPLVVLHARDHIFHSIKKQSFRNSPIHTYKPAIDFLLQKGYQVIRIGDQGMPRLYRKKPGYYEIPFLRGYNNSLDPIFIKQAHFMIGCQSGPCAYARALGVPLLSINAVFSYTLFPAITELALFKRYLTNRDGREREMSLDECLEKNVFLLENTHQLKRKGVSVENSTPEEILEAVRDMLAWLDNPNLAMTADQLNFAQKCGETADRLRRDPPKEPGIADYLGIALPGYRISPTVARLRRARSPR